MIAGAAAVACGALLPLCFCACTLAKSACLPACSSHGLQLCLSFWSGLLHVLPAMHDTWPNFGPMAGRSYQCCDVLTGR